MKNIVKVQQSTAEQYQAIHCHMNNLDLILTINWFMFNNEPIC